MVTSNALMSVTLLALTAVLSLALAQNNVPPYKGVRALVYGHLSLF